MATIRLFTHYYGDFKRLYENHSLPSLQPSIGRLKVDGHTVIPAVYEAQENTIEAMRKEVVQSVTQDAYTAICPPDTIFGAETLYNMFKIAEHKRVMIAVPHLRINYSAMDLKLPIPNKDLPRLMKAHLHDTAIFSYDHYDSNVTNGGISIRDIDNHMTIIHSLPTIYFCKFIQEDIDLIHNHMTSWNNWDGSFLAHMAQQNRVRTVGSSRLAVMAELTQDGTRLKPLTGRKHNDTFHPIREHHRVFNQFVYDMEL